MGADHRLRELHQWNQESGRAGNDHTIVGQPCRQRSKISNSILPTSQIINGTFLQTGFNNPPSDVHFLLGPRAVSAAQRP